VNHTGHAHHFLSRLDRLASAEVELALQLYREPALLRAVLAAVALPESAERVAIALGEAAVGPYLVVTRDGHFVTCLGRGMSTGQLHVVPRGQLDGLAGRFESLRERLALAFRVTGANTGERACSQLLRRVITAGDTVSREDFLAVSAWQPLLGSALMGTYLAMAAELLEQGRLLRSLRLPKARREEALHGYWALLHAAAHLALLGTMGGEGEAIEQIAGDNLTLRSAFSFGLTSSAALRFIVPGAWAVGRLGKRLLPAYKRALAEDVAFFDWLDTVFSLVAIGRRTSGLRAEVSKALGATREMVPRSSGAACLRTEMGDELAAVSAAAVDRLAMDDAESDALLARVGAHLFGLDAAKLAEIPDDVVRALPFTSYSDGLTNGKHVLASLSLIAASARRAPEEMYLPRDVERELRVTWEPRLSEELLDRIGRFERTQRAPAVRAPRPGPNEPCSCGSGRKYKKCCGSPAATQG